MELKVQLIANLKHKVNLLLQIVLQRVKQQQNKNPLKLKIMATTNENPREYENIIAKVIRVMINENAEDRISFVLDKEFETIDMKTGEEKMTNIFGMNIYNFVSQVSSFVPEIQLADAMATGQMVNPQIIALSMLNADIEIKREFHEKGEKRESTNDVYSNDCIVSKIVKVTTHIHNTFVAPLTQLIMTKPAIIKKTTVGVPNPFNM